MCLDHVDNIELDLGELELAKKKFGSHNNLFYTHIVCPHAPFIYREDGSFDVSQSLIGMFTNNRGALAENNEQRPDVRHEPPARRHVPGKRRYSLLHFPGGQGRPEGQPAVK